MSEQEFYDGWYEKALAYCNEKHILPFFAHPDVHVHMSSGAFYFDDQAHIVIYKFMRQPDDFFNAFYEELVELKKRTLQDEIDHISDMVKGPICCGDVAEICERLRKAALDMKEDFKKEHARQEAQQAALEEDEARQRAEAEAFDAEYVQWCLAQRDMGHDSDSAV